MKSIILFVFLVCLFSGCVSKEMQHAASKSAGLIHADNCQVGYGTFSGTDTESYQYIDLEFGELKNIPSTINLKHLCSIAGLNFINELSKEQYEGYNKIKVTVKNNNTEVEQLYHIEDLRQVPNHFITINKFIKYANNNALDSMSKIVDTSQINFHTQKDAVVFFKYIDSLYGKPEDQMFSGFEFKAKNNDSLVAIIKEMNYTKSTIALEFTINTLNNKIEYIKTLE